MSRFLHTLFSIALAASCVGAWAQTAAKSAPAASSAIATHMAAMDSQMKTMRAMHEKMVNAKTPEARGALMAEHTKTMQEAMAMMNTMGGAGMGDMPGGKPMPGDMNQRQQMMEKRMDMMQSMMQMMMDRMPPPAAR